jgi:hypothetical protein
MDQEKLFELYQKEREYEKKVFGDYSDAQELSFPSFILFLEEYVAKMRKAYVGRWSPHLPPWLLTCKELDDDGNAPSEAYENLIKLFALAGAALETYTQIDPKKWRANAEEDMIKWQ